MGKMVYGRKKLNAVNAGGERTLRHSKNWDDRWRIIIR